MLFNSFEFLFLFLPVSVLGFFVLGSRSSYRGAVAWLVAASFFFYGWWNPRYLALIGFSIVFNYALGLCLAKVRLRRPAALAAGVLGFGVLFNLGLIGYFKYTNFLVDSLNLVFAAGWHVDDIILPIGISFFTFQQITYLVDARRGETEEHGFLEYCLFVLFFPQLIAGPIVHHKEMLPQFARTETYRPRMENLAVGGTIFCVGLFKKVVIADNLGAIATPVFAAAEYGESLDFFQSWRGTIAYTLQLYFDFSGYSDMAIGLGRLFGIRLPINFNSPYKADNIIDFWRRWHMTLSRFLKDYVYIPLGGSRRGPARRYANLMLTMLIGGLWHGAGWTFVFWGGLHGLYLVVNHLWRWLVPRPGTRWWSRGGARLLTFFSVALAWVFFRAESFDGALAVLDGMCNLPAGLQQYAGTLQGLLQTMGFRFEGPRVSPADYQALGWLVFWLAVLWSLPNTQQWMSRYRPAYGWGVGGWLGRLEPAWLPGLLWRPSVFWAIWTGLLLTVSLLHLTRVSEFLYFQF